MKYHALALAAYILLTFQDVSASGQDMPALLAADNQRGYSEILTGVQLHTEHYLPLLIHALDHPDREISTHAMAALAKVGRPAAAAICDSLPILAKPENGIHALGMMGPTATEAIPALLPYLKNPDKGVRIEALTALAAIGPYDKRAAAGLIAATTDPSERIQETAIDLLGGYPVLARRARRTMIALLAAPSAPWTLKAASARTLGKIGPPADEAIPVLLQSALHSARWEVRTAALAALEATAGRKPEIARSVLGLLNDKDSRFSVTEVLKNAARSHSTIRRLLIDRFPRMGPEARREIIGVMGEIGPSAADAVPFLMAHSHDKDDALRRSAFRAMANVSPGSAQVLALLTTALQDLGASTRVDSVEALAIVGASNNRALPVLAAALKDRDPGVRESAAEAMGSLGVKARSVLPALLARADPHTEIDDPVRRAVENSLITINPSDPRVVHALIGFLRDTNPQSRYHAAETLAVLKADAGEAVPAYLSEIRSGEGPLQYFANLALPNAVSRRWVPYLKSRLADPSARVRRAVVKALAGIKPMSADIPFALRARFMQESDVEVRGEIITAMGSTGPFAREHVPFLLSVLQAGLAASDSEKKERVGAVLEALAEVRDKRAVPLLLVALQKGEPSAAEALASIGDRAAVSALLAAPVKEPDSDFGEQTIVRALARLGEGDALPLVRALRDPSPAARQRADSALIEMGPKALPVLPDLIDSLKPDDPEARSSVVRILSQIGPRAVPALVASLARPEVRPGVAEALARIGPIGATAVPALSEALRDPRLPVQNAVVAALAATGAKEAVAPLAERLDHAEADMRVAAAAALATIHREEALPVLVKLLSDSDPGVRAEAARSLRLFDHAAIPAVSPLLRADAGVDDRVVAAALRALPEGPLDTRVASTVVEATQHTNATIRCEAIDVLGRCTIRTAPTVPILIAAAQDTNPEVRLRAIRALGSSWRGASPAASVLVGLLTDPAPAVREAAALALGQIGPRADTAVPALVRALRDDDDPVRSAAALAIRDIGSRASLVVPALTRALGDMNADVRQNACAALGAYGKQAKSALPRIIEFAQTPEDDLYAQCAENKIAERFDHGIWDMRWIKTAPRIPWPPPTASGYHLVSPARLTRISRTMGDVYDRIVTALNSSGYTDRSVLQVPGGFAIATRVERIHADGRSDLGDRWTLTTHPLGAFNLLGYLHRLFFGPQDQFRLFLITVTPYEVATKPAETPLDQAATWVSADGHDLPESVRPVKLSTTGLERCYVWIYHFMKQPDGSLVAVPSPLTGEEHCRMAGLLRTFGE